MKISAIVAINHQGAIGLKGKMPWHHHDEYQSFLTKVSGHYILMGTTNWSENKDNAPLRERTKILVLSRSLNEVDHAHLTVSSKLETLIQKAKSSNEKELFVIGGAQIYELLLPYVQNFYLSIVDYQGPADCYFPPFESYPWKIEQATNLVPNPNSSLDLSNLFSHTPWRYYQLSKLPSQIFT